MVAYAWWGLRRLSYPEAIYTRMCWLGWLVRASPRPQETPWEYGARLCQAVPAARPQVSCIAGNYAWSLYYGPLKGLTPEQRQELARAWQSLRRTLVKHFLSRLLAGLLGWVRPS